MVQSVPEAASKLVEPPPTVRTFWMSAVMDGGPSPVVVPSWVLTLPVEGVNEAALLTAVPAIPLMLVDTPKALDVPTERFALVPLDTLSVTDLPSPATRFAGSSGAVWATATGATTAWARRAPATDNQAKLL